ncbi:bifunctional DNA primase/polymerase [Deinococcus fonticola]|uniref:bifunctional DNA primase/polymerase n=1 Tax=Deinococcus fonticola TaxID=2528713 RepID=UPI0010751BAF|nr:bifunctional DNA primase/polymerase [Deinococcus fonticola]
MNTVLNAALEAVTRGWSVFPVQTKGSFAKKPHWCLVDTGHSREVDGKLRPSWAALQHTPPTPEQVRTWYARETDKGVAVVTGAVSGLIVLDFDGAAGEQLRERLGLPAHVRTGSGGAHVYLQHPGWKVATLNSKAKKEMGEKWPGLDIRADGGYAVMPPSENASGPYRWEAQPGMPEPLPLDTLPADLRAFLGLVEAPRVSSPAPRAAEPPRASYAARSGDGRVNAALLIDRALKQVDSGAGRNNAGAWLAAQLRDNGYSESEALPHMEAYAGRVGSHDTHGQHDPYTVSQARASLQSMYSRAARKPWEARQTSTPDFSTPQPGKPSQPAQQAEPEQLALPADVPVIVTGEAALAPVEAALKLDPELATARRTLTGEELRSLVQDGRPVFIIKPTQAQERALDASGVEWYTLPDLPLTASPEELLRAIEGGMVDALPITGNLDFLQDELPALADLRLKRGGNTYPTGLQDFDEAIGGGFYDGLHVLGGVTGGGKTALALAIAEHNARQGRPVLYVTFEQSRYELWGRLISTKVGVGLRQLRTGGTAEHPVGEQLRRSPAYQDLTQTVGPYLTVNEGNGVDGGAWGVDRIAAQVKRLKAVHGVSPLVILDYLQRMPAGDNKDRRHQIDETVTALQVRLGRELNTPLLLISSVGRGNYGELLKEPLEARLSVFKESGGVEYTAYTASLLYPLGAQDVMLLGLESAPVPGSGRAALKGLWKYLVLDLVKNREGEAPRQWIVKWHPARGTFEVVRAVDVSELEGISGNGGRKGGKA